MGSSVDASASENAATFNSKGRTSIALASIQDPLEQTIGNVESPENESDT